MPLKKLYNLVQTLHLDPLTFKKAVLLCLCLLGFQFLGELLLALLGISFGILPDIFFLVAVLVIARGMGRDELRRIFVWRDIPIPVFAGIMVMFFGLEIIKSELSNLLQSMLPVPDGFFSSRFYMPKNAFFVIVAHALFPGFTEEVFFRGVIARRFFRHYSPIKSVLLSAALFGIIHLNPWQAVNAFYAGIFYGWIYWRYRTVWLCMFAHAYHNILVSYMSFPYVAAGKSGYQQVWRHPLWFDIMGLLLFGFGLLTVIVLSRKKDAER